MKKLKYWLDDALSWLWAAGLTVIVTACILAGSIQSVKWLLSVLGVLN